MSYISNAPIGQDLAPELRRTLASLDNGLAPALDEHQIGQLLAYVSMLSQWGKTYNLTAVRKPAEMLTLHLLDSLAVRAPLWRHLQGEPAAILDVGSGGGLPGVVLAITMPQLQVTCVDAVAKKAAFVRQVAAELRLPNLKAEHARVETLRAKPWQVITSRAFASLRDFVTLTSGLRADGGVWMAMKGKNPLDEVAELPSDVSVFHVEQLQVPGLDAERCLVWLR
ncbi:MAG: 16S rRNA (guanine(527)-N(7))-methyltransferase RsmG [Rubrivivax sp.]|nr:MAG: 16S rRNA (guanine(527)-N(7))-methyltransferase RsmG [Rubrivivax sp.]